jgi:hypothetical protein
MNNALAHWTMAVNFLRLTEGACGQLVAGKNAHVLVTDSPTDPLQYRHMTMWSDHSVGVPILFNFFHGIELILKGFIATASKVPTHHFLSKLHCEFEILFPRTVLGETISKFVCDIDPNSPLGRFNIANGINIDSWYQALKYPTSTKGKSFTHVELRYGGMRTVDFWESIELGSSSIRMDAVELARFSGCVNT